MIPSFFRPPFVAALAAAALVTASPASAQVTVTGEATVSAAPDMARVSLGVMQTAETAASAVAAMNADMERVMAQLAAAGVPAESITTSTLRIEPQQTYAEGQPPVIASYLAATDVQVRVTNLADLGGILDAVVREGANQIYGLQFDLADRAPLVAAARRAAVADAQARATLYADAAGLALGPVTQIFESSGTQPPMPMARSAMFDGAAEMVVAPGSLDVTATITLVYAIAAE